MPLMTLADIIHRRVALSAREAATLTLAVAGEWDRQRALRGAVSVPEPGGITLRPDGRVAFLVALPVSAADDAAALSGLFGELLGIDEPPPAPRARIADSSVGAARSGAASMELPASTVEAFRAALSRFGEDNPALLSAIYHRAAAAMAQPVASRGTNGGVVGTYVANRRRVPETVTELRRELRDYEQQAYEERRERTHTRATRTTLRPSPPRLVAAWLAAGCTAAVLLGVGIAAVGGRTAPSPGPSRTLDAAAAPAMAIRRADIALASSPPPIEQAPRPRTAARDRARANRPSLRSAAAARRPAQAHQVFAGGARSIAWMAGAPAR